MEVWSTEKSKNEPSKTNDLELPIDEADRWRERSQTYLDNGLSKCPCKPLLCTITYESVEKAVLEHLFSARLWVLLCSARVMIF